MNSQTFARRRRVVVSLASIVCSVGASRAASGEAPSRSTTQAAIEAAEPAPGGETNELADLSIDELMAVDVTSVTGVKQAFFKTPAAAYVIRREDIEAAGHLTLAESLRVVPGVHVARESSNLWSIGTRGFNGRLSNKQLVLIDGRVVYDPFFAGVMWDVQQPFLADVDTVEVIRGPGATLWGSNAVNGVINVNTLSARDTQGAYLSGIAGVGDTQAGLNARYGGRLGADAYYRVYGQFLDDDHQAFADGSSAQDNWQLLKGGLRLDFGRPGDVTLTIAGEGYDTDRLGSQQVARSFVPGVPDRVDAVENSASGGHVSARLARERGDDGWQLQFVVDHFARDVNGLHADAMIYDADWRAHFKTDDRNEVVWGLGLHVFHYETRHDDDAQFFYEPADGTKTTATAFLQDTYAIVPDRVFAMLGTKVEHNDYSGFEVQPSARLWWTPDDRHTVWTAVSRSVRVPSLTDTSITVQPPFPGVPAANLGNPNADAEVAWTYELGYRQRLTSALTLDVSSYYGRYTRLLSNTSGPSAASTPPNNGGAGHTYGLETSVQWQASDDLAVTLGYAYGREELEDRYYRFAPTMPEHMVHLGAEWRVTRDVKLDAHGYYVDAWDDGISTVNAYVRVDLGLRWRIGEHCEFAIFGQNLLDNRHPESSRGTDEAYGDTTEIGRSAYAQLSFRF